MYIPAGIVDGLQDHHRTVLDALGNSDAPGCETITTIDGSSTLDSAAGERERQHCRRQRLTRGNVRTGPTGPELCSSTQFAIVVVVIVEHRTLRRPIIDVFSRDRNIELIAQDASIESRDDRSGARADDSTAQEESEGDIVQDLCDAADATNLQDVRFIRPEVLGVALDESVRPMEPLHVSDPAVSYGSLPSTSITVPTHFTYGTRLGISVWAVKQLDLREPQRRHARRRASIETVILVRWVRRMRQKAERLRRFSTGSREITLAGYGRSDASLHSTL